MFLGLFALATAVVLVVQQAGPLSQALLVAPERKHYQALASAADAELESVALAIAAEAIAVEAIAAKAIVACSAKRIEAYCQHTGRVAMLAAP